MKDATGKTDCQIYVIVDALAGEATKARLATALSVAPVASVLLIPQISDGASTAAVADQLRPLVEMAQSSGAAVLVSEDIALMRDLGCDGVHLSLTSDGRAPIAALQAARNALLDNFIAGAEAGDLRDDAMQLGENSTDYVAFPLLDAADDPMPAETAQLQRVSWWAEIFEIPCVAFDVTKPEQATGLAAAGADFIAIKLPANAPPAEVKEFVESMAQAIIPNNSKGQ